MISVIIPTLNREETLCATIRYFLEHETYRPFELIVVDHPWYHRGFILDQVEFLPSWIIHWLKDVYLKYAKKFDSNEKIYIDRTESKFNHCQIQNDNEIFNVIDIEMVLKLCWIKKPFVMVFPIKQCL